MHHHWLLACVVVSAVAVTTLPPKGWNSWDSFRGDLTEEQLMETAGVVKRYLLPYGYDTVTIDEFWYLDNCAAGVDNCLDYNGRPQPDIKKWPSSAGGKGFKPVADKLHSWGLKLGIHTLRGSITVAAVEAKSPVLGAGGVTVDQLATTLCKWNKNWYGVNTSHPAAAKWLDSVYGQYAEWGVDFIKNDCIFADNYLGDGIKAVSEAMQRTGRPFTYSLSPGGPELPDEVKQSVSIHSYVNMYRVTPDWHGGDITYHYDIADAMSPLIGATGYHGGRSFPDLDMLNPYKNAVTDLDFRRQMTLWSITRSPLIYGADIRNMTAKDFVLLTNKEVLAVTDESRGNQQVYRTKSAVAWTATGPNSVRYVALFNLLKTESPVVVHYNQLNSTASTCDVRDLWANRDLGSATSVTVTLPPLNGAALVALSKCH